MAISGIFIVLALAVAVSEVDVVVLRSRTADRMEVDRGAEGVDEEEEPVPKMLVHAFGFTGSCLPVSAAV